MHQGMSPVHAKSKSWTVSKNVGGDFDSGNYLMVLELRGTHDQYATGFAWLDIRNKVDYLPRVKTGPSEKITSRLQGPAICTKVLGKVKKLQDTVRGKSSSRCLSKSCGYVLLNCDKPHINSSKKLLPEWEKVGSSSITTTESAILTSSVSERAGTLHVQEQCQSPSLYVKKLPSPQPATTLSVPLRQLQTSNKHP
ncbi:hypothetical protein MUK42_30005 [Musa troglodytarum]|uniref:Uncharacterized protein n=1 Tax=Musa troglodytarum TaxID=320322 RepID=A0A9E7EXY9_9LILI|nr:hypothetical protein MUK42_30005 [Musa troglodytarum]